MEKSNKNSNLAKNTLLLYLRMIVIVLVGLYTSRVVLNTLGVSDFGVYNVVGGFVAMLAYIKTGFVTATQRFLSFALGEGDVLKLKTIFSAAVSVYYILSFVLLLLAETIGLWYLNNYIVIDAERLLAARWVFQFSIMSFIVDMIGIPYNATIVAHEHMDIYAYISIYESLAKLFIVFLLTISSFDSLILYSILTFLVSLSVRLVYVIYCRLKFNETRGKLSIDFPLLKKMYIFAGWTAVGTLGFSFKDQFINLILNLFGGTVLNAARGIAMQVSGIVNQFASNFLMAVSPQITKQFASKSFESSRDLVYLSTKFTFFLMTILVIPLSVNLDFLLSLWLGLVPKYTYEFVLVVLVGTLIGSLSSPSTIAIQATGKVRDFQLGIAIIFLLEVPSAYILLKYGFSPYIALLPSILCQLFGVIYRYYILSSLVSVYKKKYYYINIVLRSTFVTSLCFIIGMLCASFTTKDFLGFVFNSFFSVLLSLGLIWVLGLNSTERHLVKTYIYKVAKL